MQYLPKEELVKVCKFDFSKFEPISTDTYDESAILASIKTKNLEELFACALQFAIVGCGNKNFGEVKLNGQSHRVLDLLVKNGVNVKTMKNSKLLPEELTIKRLTRFFRFHISAYIKKTGSISFLCRKYLSNDSPEYVFPGAEYMLEGTQCDKLLSAYTNLDAELGTNFVEKIKLIFRARKVIWTLSEIYRYTIDWVKHVIKSK